jgi:hypothetical protein
MTWHAPYFPKWFNSVTSAIKVLVGGGALAKAFPLKKYSRINGQQLGEVRQRQAPSISSISIEGGQCPLVSLLVKIHLWTVDGDVFGHHLLA